MEARKAKCPFCVGDGCCYCDHLGFVPFNDGSRFKIAFGTEEEMAKHNPEISLLDVEIAKGIEKIQ